MKIKIYIIILLIISLSSCKQGLLDTFPYDALPEPEMWKDVNSTESGVIAVYAPLRGYIGQKSYYIESWGVSSDYFKQYLILTGKAAPSNYEFSDYWLSGYSGIDRANYAIENLPKAVASSSERRNQLLAEAKFLRAFYYYKLNIVFGGVQLFEKPISVEDALNTQRSSAKDVWYFIIKDLSDVINEPNMPDKVEDKDFGRASKGAAYALRGKAYMWIKEWQKAENDFKKIGSMGYSLFQGGYKELFKEKNENCPEMIFSVQNISESDLSNDISYDYSSRVSFGGGSDSYYPNTDFVDTYELSNGKKFNWDDFIPGYSSLSSDQRSVYFFRDSLTKEEISIFERYNNKPDMSKYLITGNEERIKKAYENRDPRLLATVITPYSTYLGSSSNTNYTYTLRFPYRGFDEQEPFDIRSNTSSRFHYLFRKFVPEGSNEIIGGGYSPIDLPIIRYADVLLNLAESLNEQGKTSEAIEYINLVRDRAGVAKLNSNEYTQVTDQDNLRERIRNERRWEFAGEGITYFDELRWHTWKEKKFFKGSGLKEIWGSPIYEYSWQGDYAYLWPIPNKDVGISKINLKQNPGWFDN